jgi:hypothetical protein
LHPYTFYYLRDKDTTKNINNQINKEINVTIMSSNSMKPMDVGGIRLIPQGNLNVNQPGSYGSMMKALTDTNKSTFVSGSSSYPGFTPGYTVKGLEGCWQCATFSK